LAGGFSAVGFVPNIHKEIPPTTAISKISATIAARIAILTAFFITKKVIAATASKKTTKIIAVVVVIILFRVFLFRVSSLNLVEIFFGKFGTFGRHAKIFVSPRAEVYQFAPFRTKRAKLVAAVFGFSAASGTFYDWHNFK